MGRAVATASTTRGAYHQRDAGLRKHSRELHRVVVKLIHGQGQEVRKHDFDNGTVAVERETDGSSHYTSFTNRRRDHAAGITSAEPGRYFEGAILGDVATSTEN